MKPLHSVGTPPMEDLVSVGGTPLVPKQTKYPRLSRPVPTMRPEYDAVVVGSGYGGAVAASRMARAGKSVAVLELGMEKWPGEYPTNSNDVPSELHVSGQFSGSRQETSVGKPTGLYHIIVGEGQNAFVGNGLGGTSLINANVFLEADARTLELDDWPEEIRNPASLRKYYARAAEMLQPTPYPHENPTPKKLHILEKQAHALGFGNNFYRAPQTTFFHDGVNNAGVEMKASTASGQDCTGVNDGSKNSVLMNYLPDAWNWGAEIFCECEVRYVLKNAKGSGYTVFFAWHGNGRSSFEDSFYTELMWVQAKELCFLGAGALGTTEILLRSKAHGLQVSRFVGQKLSGNGDMLAFGYDTDETINAVSSENPSVADPPGCTITGVIDNRGPETCTNVLDGYVLEEGIIPGALTPAIELALEDLADQKRPRISVSNRLRQLFSCAKSLRARGAHCRLNRTQTYLVMSHDSNEGVVTLENDRPCMQFLGVERAGHARKMRELLADATKVIGGTLVNPPLYSPSRGRRQEMTVHPLGGAVMSSDGTGRGGATNHIGQLFIGEGNDIYDGLVCVDASIIPCALGVNPLATITALAERSVDLIAKKRCLTVDTSKNGRLNLFGQPAKSLALSTDINVTTKAIESVTHLERGIRFSEIMTGHIYIGDNIDDFIVAENAAKGSSSSARFFLSVDVHNVYNLTNMDHGSLATGTFSCGALSQHPLRIVRGEVQFFTVDETVSDATNLVYKLTLLSTEGESYVLNGYKMIDYSMSYSASETWKATSTLYTTLTRLDASVVGRGRLHISWRNFASELKSMRKNSLHSSLKFLRYFSRNLARYSSGSFSPLEYPDRSHTGYLPKVAPTQTVALVARDGVQTTMKVWTPEKLVDIDDRKVPILMIPGASVDDQIFSLPTIPHNTVEYFTSRGYTVYATTLRFGRTPAAEQGDTAFDARLDVAAAMNFVHEQSPGKMYILCHCVGAIATSMGMLDGTIPTEWVQGLTASQVFFKQQFGFVNGIKARTSTPTKIYKLLGGPWFPMSSTPNDPSTFQRFLDQALRFYPIDSTSELCSSTVCHRCSLVFGRLWNHDNLTHATHAHLINFFGGIHMDMLAHLMRTGTAHNDLDEEGHNLVTEVNLRRLKGVPMLFISGGDNVVFDPMSTSMSYDVMRKKFGSALYKRVVVAGYGHLDTWMGKRSNVDVYPIVMEHVEWCEDHTALNQSNEDAYIMI